MLGLLKLDVIACIINEWIANYHELTNLEIALSNYFHRDKYLLALKSLCKATQLYEESPVFPNESKLMTLVAWKEGRDMRIDKLHLKVYSTSIDKILISFFPGLLQLTIDKKETEFDLSLIAVGCFPTLEKLKLVNLKIYFGYKIPPCRCKPLELKELYLIENKFQPEKIVLFDSLFGYLVVFGQYCQKLQKLRYEPGPQYTFFDILAKLTQQIPSLQRFEYYCGMEALPLWTAPPLLNTQFQSNIQDVHMKCSASEQNTSSFVRLLTYCCNSDAIKYLTLSLTNVSSAENELLLNWITSYGHNLQQIVLDLYNSRTSANVNNMGQSSNMILRKIAETCKTLQVLHLSLFYNMDVETIVQLFQDGVCKVLHTVKFSFIEGVSKILEALCESNYPIESLSIHCCTQFQLTSLLNVIDTFHLKELHLLLVNENLSNPAVQGKAMFTEFMRKLMKSPNMLQLEHLTVDFSPRNSTTNQFTREDEREIIDHWLFPFPELRSLTLNISLNVDPLVNHVLFSRIFKHCPKLEELEWNNNHTCTCSKYDLIMIHRVRNQCAA